MLAVDGDLQFDKTGGSAAADDEIIEGELGDFLLAQGGAAFDKRPFFDGELSSPDARQFLVNAGALNRSEKAETADVDPEYRGGEARYRASGPEHSAVATEDKKHVGFFGESGAVRIGLDAEVGKTRRGCV